MKTAINLLLSLCFLMLSTACKAQSENGYESEKLNYTLEPVVTGLGIPWGMVFLPDGSILISEKSGKLIHLKDGSQTEIKNVPEVYKRGQGGLLDLELHPDYKNNGWIYITYASSEGEGEGGNTALIRAKLNNGSLTDIQKLYKGEENTTKGQHFGSRIEFDNQGYVYFSIGDRGNRDENPQSITRDGGKIYRLHDDGRIPKDNPFVNETNAKKAIYSYGHRNPQGLVKHPLTGEIWNHEHGPMGGDEINVIQSGKNYGWPSITYGINYNGTPITDQTEAPGLEQPIHFWVPSIAPSGMAFVTSDVYPAWKGNLMVGSLKFQLLERLEMTGRTVTHRENLMLGVGRVRNVRQGPDGYLYVAFEGKGIYKVVPKK
jgi:glucose/arabinose dehydrogenase